MSWDHCIKGFCLGSRSMKDHHDGETSILNKADRFGDFMKHSIGVIHRDRL